MDRRSFIRIGMAGAVSGIIAPKIVLAGVLGEKINNNSMAGGIYYTKDSPGRWAKKAGSHSPILEKTDSGIKVVTGHPMQQGKHWIVKHVLLDSDFKFISENIFDPAKHKAAISNFTLSGQSKVVYALSVCNLHDSWLSVLEV
ncbi:MAG: desulfoferrodoxin family protein [Gammaproteobacteria bacterium]|nr:desulfoferrodoxin family protein [Gammaproteobacteria bacterium]